MMVELTQDSYRKCELCPRKCGINRYETTGYCNMPAKMVIGRAALHKWEEPCISGDIGSGTIFFYGCNLRCVFCQNMKLSGGQIQGSGKEITQAGLVKAMLELEHAGAMNINFVTPSHYAPSVAQAIQAAKEEGLQIPIVYNTGSYELPSTLALLEGLVDIYLPDLKYYSDELARKYSNAPDYFNVAAEAIHEMLRQTGKPEFDEHGMMKKGVLVRHLLMPGGFEDSRKIIKYLHDTYHNDIYISIMSQYTPMKDFSDMPELNHKVKHSVYEHLINIAIQEGIENAFIQEGETAKESFIPDFY